MLTKFPTLMLVPKTKRNKKVTDTDFHVQAARIEVKSVSSGIRQTWDAES